MLPRAEMLRTAALQRNDFRRFAGALDQRPDGLGLIAEVKKASPSAGVIATDFDPVQVARAYEAAGAHAISVLTDERYFQGHLSYLPMIREAVGLPLLRKDFLLHEVQIFESVVAGADAVLLIVAALEDEALQALHRTAMAFQLDVLVEVHTLEELERALEIEGLALLGINNRNLSTFEVSLETTVVLSEEVPEDVLLVGESGIKCGDDARLLFANGVDALLVGETLMRSGNVEAAVRELLAV